MATIDLGKIKQVWRGTYNNSTAYVVDDLVAYTDSNITSTYICVANSTGNAPSSGGTAHASWNYVAKGVVDPIPSQSGNAGKVLKTDGSSVSWGADQGGKLLNSVGLVTADSTHTTSSSFGNATGFTLSITPSATTSKILVLVSSNMECDGSNNSSHATILRTVGSSLTNLGHSSGGLSQLHEYYYPGSQDQEVPCNMSILDSPNTTSEVNYKVQIRLNGGTRAGWNGAQRATKGTMTLIEVGA